jgi:arsenite-transporting ATPase
VTLVPNGDMKNGAATRPPKNASRCSRYSFRAVQAFRDRMEHARKLLTDPALTSFFFVVLPEALPIAVVMRFIQWFKDFGIPVGGVLVNMQIDPASIGADAAEFVKNRVAMQQEHMQTIWREFDGSVRAIVPLFETEVRGVPMLERLCDAIFAADGAKPAPAEIAPCNEAAAQV